VLLTIDASAEPQLQEIYEHATPPLILVHKTDLVETWMHLTTAHKISHVVTTAAAYNRGIEALESHSGDCASWESAGS